MSDPTGIVLRLVNQGCENSLEISAELGITIKQSSKYLWKLASRGLIVSRGTYWRPDHFGRPFKRYAPLRSHR